MKDWQATVLSETGDVKHEQRTLSARIADLSSRVIAVCTVFYLDI